MTDPNWVDINLTDVRSGDEVRLDGYGSQGSEYQGDGFHVVSEVWDRNIRINPSLEVFRRSAIIAARRAVAKPGDWQCVDIRGSLLPFLHHEKDFPHRAECSVYREGSGWSTDGRYGKPWTIQDFAPMDIVVRCSTPGDSISALRKAEGTVMNTWPPRKNETVGEYYNRIGIDVRPVDRRKR